MEGGEQETGCDADTFLNVVVLDPGSVCGEAIINPKYDYKIGCGFEEGLLPVCSKGGEGGEPIQGKTVVVVFALFFFGGDSNLVLEVGRGNYNKTPRLLVGPGGGRGGCRNGLFDGCEGDGCGAEVADAAAGEQAIAEFGGIDLGQGKSFELCHWVNYVKKKGFTQKRRLGKAKGIH